MVERGCTTFSATKVAMAGLVDSAALQKIMDLEREVSKLRHHVSVLSKRNRLLQKKVDGRKEEKEAGCPEVASPDRVEEPEPQVVAEALERMSGEIVAEDEENMWVAHMAKPAVGESRVVLEMDEAGVAIVVLPKGKRRRLTNGGEEGGDETDVMTVVPVEEERRVIVTRLKPREALVPTGPRGDLFPV